MMENEIVRCSVCNEDKKISDIAKGYVNNGEVIYVCKVCYDITKR